MVFSSVSFVFMFLPIVLLFYYISAERYKNIVLLIASLLFYSFGEPTAFWLMLVSIGINYIAGYFLDHLISPHGRKAVLIVDVVCNLGILFFFKYLDYTISIFNYFSDIDILTLNIALPIGISFFTFQGMSYVIDVYRREVAAEKNILTVGLYISFFPQLIAGPIVRYHSIAEQLRCRTVSVDQIADGVKRFLLGFCKKVLLANQLALLAESAFQYEDFTSRPIALAWLGSIAYSLQIFYDFAGYSDMAIGLGKMFGFEFEENFNYPYIARSVTDFWRRWHISLSRWFRDYVYIPLGGGRVGAARHILNLFVVWCLTGIWHGANITFVIWGLIYFIFLVFEKYCIKPEKRNFVVRVFWQIATLLLINFEWVIFNSGGLHSMVRYFRSMFGYYGNVSMDAYTYRMFHQYGFFVLLGILFSMPIAPRVSELLCRSSYGKRIVAVAVPIMYMSAFLWAISYLILGAHNPFIYFNF